ncbi:MAG: carbohydrate kinase family protein [Devosiaceae bacterium]|nr:carbohydrate kinase family protein [Devosiaceae bacterium MH13]
MQRSGVICAGNWIVDLVHEIGHWPAEHNLVRIGGQSRSMGGGPANVIAALCALETGLDLLPMGAIGDDEYGAFIRQSCATLGLDTGKMAVKPSIATAHTHVMSAAGQSRTFFYQGGANDALSLDDFPAGTFAQTGARIFYLGYLTLLGTLDALEADGSTQAARVLERAQKAGLTTCVDLVSVHHDQFRSIVGAAAPFIDFLILNEIEAARAIGRDAHHDELGDPLNLLTMGRDLLDAGVCKAVVLHCADRAVWVGADGARHLQPVDPLPSDQIASHLGAGDAFCSGILYAVHEGWEPEDALRLANTVARESLKGTSASEAIPALHQLAKTRTPS